MGKAPSKRIVKPADPDSLCGFISKSSGRPCKNRPLTGGAKHCAKHGGKQELLAIANAADHHTMKTGAHSKYRDHLFAGEAYRAALANQGDLLSNTHEIALIESLIHRVGDDLKGLTDPKIWEKLDAAVHGFRTALRAKDTPAQMRYFADIEKIAGQGLYVSAGIKSLREMLLERNKLVVDQNRMTLAADEVVTKEQVLGFVMSVSDIINRRVTNKAEREGVQIDLMMLLGKPVHSAPVQ